MGSILDATGKNIPENALQAWARVALRYGVASVIAMYLVWWGTQSFGSDLTAMRNEQRMHMSETAFYLRQVCLNTAKDDAQRAACIPPK